MPAITRNGLKLHFDTQGDGPAIVLCHSFLCSGKIWQPQLQMLSERHTVINVDFRGHGQSGPADVPCTLNDLVDDVVAILDHLQIDKAIWFGLSIGGMVAMRAAINHPARVKALVLFDTDAGEEDRWVRWRNRALGLVTRMFGIRPVLPKVEQLMFGSTTRRSQPELLEQWRAEFLAVRVASAMRMLGALNARQDLTSKLKSLQLPALVVVGAEDKALPPDRSRAIAAAINGSQFEMIENSGHVPTLEKPAAVNKIVRDFLDRIDGP